MKYSEKYLQKIIGICPLGSGYIVVLKIPEIKRYGEYCRLEEAKRIYLAQGHNNDARECQNQLEQMSKEDNL